MSRIVEFFRKPIPREVVKNVHEISYSKFKLLGFDTIIFDYDNTLAPFRRDVSGDIVELLNRLLDAGFKVAVVTNAPLKRTEMFRKKLPRVQVFAKARKPGLKTVKLAVRRLDSKPSETVFVGDLFFTDIIAGNRLGMYTILVEPYPGVGLFLGTIALLERVSYSVLFYTFGWLFRISELASPNEWRSSIFEVDYDHMIASGVKLFVFDMDNTLARWRASKLDKKALELLKYLSNRVHVTVLSNGNSPSLNWLARNSDVNILRHSHKPFTGKLIKLMKKYNVSKSEVVVVGDQLFTDILMSNLAGVYSVKVEPISRNEILFTRLLRIFERIVKPLIKSKPSIASKNKTKREIKRVK